jgi:hypothetical protein
MTIQNTNKELFDNFENDLSSGIKYTKNKEDLLFDLQYFTSRDGDYLDYLYQDEEEKEKSVLNSAFKSLDQLIKNLK